MFTPGNWQKAKEIRAVGQANGVDYNAINQFLKPILGVIPGANWNQIAKEVDNANPDAGLHIVQGGLNLVGKVLPPARALGNAIEKAERASKKIKLDEFNRRRI